MTKATLVKTDFLAEIKSLITEARRQVAQTVNAEMSLLYWKVGQRIKTEILGNEKAAYGKAVIKNLSAALTTEYGSGWSEKQLLHCLRSVETFPDFRMVSTLWRQLSWSHIKILIPVGGPANKSLSIPSHGGAAETLKKEIFKGVGLNTQPLNMQRTILTQLNNSAHHE